ncbi:cytochrome P450 71A1-like protein, partial [Tanacetum coccineum]
MASHELFTAKRLASHEYIRVDEQSGVLNIGDWIPWIGFVDLQGYVKRMKAVSKKFDRFLENVLDVHEARKRAEGESFVPKDMVDLLLQISDDSTLDVKIERHGVKGFTQVPLQKSFTIDTLLGLGSNSHWQNSSKRQEIRTKRATTKDQMWEQNKFKL